MMQKASVLRDLTVEELKAQCQELSREIFEMNSTKSITRKAEKPHLFREKKRDRARLLTVLHEKGATL